MACALRRSPPKHSNVPKPMLCDLSVCNCQKCIQRRNEPESWKYKGKKLAKKLAHLSKKSPFGKAEGEDEVKCSDLTHVIFDIIGAISKTKVIVLSATAVVALAIFLHYAVVSLIHLKSTMQKKPPPAPINAEATKTGSRSAQPTQPTQSASKSATKASSTPKNSKPDPNKSPQPVPPSNSQLKPETPEACKKKEMPPPPFLYLPKSEKVTNRPAGLLRNKPTVLVTTRKSDRNRLKGGFCRNNCPPARNRRKFKFCSLLDSCDKRKFGGQDQSTNTEDRATNTPMSDEQGRAIFQTYRMCSYPMEMKSIPGPILYLYNCLFRRICPGPSETSVSDD
uniref:Uncharacterized protein n=1 Tax=Glossina brevipalpis TaxID=37001 RepID=A0A1A9WR82_9MUSC